jgi:hypothetical protein
MTNTEFHNTFYGPSNQLNRERLCRHLEITGFAGLNLKRMGWTGFINALGDHYKLDVRNFTCQAKFIDALADMLK